MNHPFEEQPFDDQAFAELTGLELDPPAESSDPILDEADAQVFEPDASSWTYDPKVQLVVAGAGVGVAAIGLSLLVGTLSPSSPKVEQAERSEKTETAATEDETAALRQQLDELKTELALREQEQGFAAVEAESEPSKPDEPSLAALPAAPVAALPPPPLPSVFQPVAQPALPTSVPPPLVAPEQFPVEPPPAERLAALQAIGSYGAGVALHLPTVPVPEPLVDPSQPVRFVSNEPQLLAGNRAAAVLETPLFWTPALRQTGDPVVIALTEALSNGQGELPTGTQLLARLETVERGGLARLAVTAIIRDGQTQPVPEGSISIRAQDGAPLVAQQYPEGSSETVGQDVERALLGTLARGASDILRPRSGNDFTDRLIEGASSELLKTVTKPTRKKTRSRPTIWYLPEGITVQVVVKRPVTTVSTIATQAQPTLLPSAAPAEGITVQGIPNRPVAATPAVAAQQQPVLRPSVSSPATHSPVSSRVTRPIQTDAATVSSPVLPGRQTIVVKVWPGHGANISFLRTQETIVRAWVDDPSMVAVDFDQPLCAAAEDADCTAGNPAIIHLRQLEGIAVPNLPSAEGTLLTVVTQTPAGQRQIHTFRIERGTGQPQTRTLDIPSPSPVTSPPVPAKVSQDAAQLAPSHIERGTDQTEARTLDIPPSSPATPSPPTQVNQETAQLTPSVQHEEPNHEDSLEENAAIAPASDSPLQPLPETSL